MNEFKRGYVIKAYDVIFGEAREMIVYPNKKNAQTSLEYMSLEDAQWAKDANLELVPIEWREIES